MTITWTRTGAATGTFAFVSVVLTPSGGGSSVSLNSRTSNTGSFGPFNPATFTLRQGTYTATVRADTIQGTSTSTLVVAACQYRSCGSFGSCVTVAGQEQCQCTAGYSGPDCTVVSPCVGFNCQNGGTCVVVAGTTAACDCSTAGAGTSTRYGGANCQTAVPCTVSCQHAGVQNNSCGCNCVGKSPRISFLCWTVRTRHLG